MRACQEARQTGEQRLGQEACPPHLITVDAGKADTARHWIKMSTDMQKLMGKHFLWKS